MLAAAHPQLWWFVARSSGLVAWALSGAAVLWGVLLGTRLLGRRPQAPWLTDLHRFLGALSVVFVGVHVLALVADSHTHWGPVDLLVPLASSWKPGPTAWGIVAAYVLVAVEITSLLGRRIPKKAWRAVHLTSYLLFASATMHLATAGTDRTNRLVAASAALLVALVIGATTYRVIGPGRAAIRRTPERHPDRTSVAAP